MKARHADLDLDTPAGLAAYRARILAEFEHMTMKAFSEAARKEIGRAMHFTNRTEAAHAIATFRAKRVRTQLYG